MTVTLSSNWKR